MKKKLKPIVLLKDRVSEDLRGDLVGTGLYAANALADECGLKQIIVLCNAGKERSRMLASALEYTLRGNFDYSWLAESMGTFGLGSDDKGVATKYGWVPSPGFVGLIRQEGIELSTSPSHMISEKDAEAAKVIIAVDPVIAARAKEAYPTYSSKVLVALDAIDQGYNPFPGFLGNSIPDAWGGHLSETVWNVMQGARSADDRLQRVELALGETLDEAVQRYVSDYDPKHSHPSDIKSIPAKLRDYLGHPLDCDEGYLHEARMMKHIAYGLVEGGCLR